jgi:glycosyltransferase involved in cell wall biosynthesis
MFFQAILAVRAKYPRARILFHVHGEELAQLDPRPIERYLRQADLIIGVSEYITRGLQRNFPRLADRCRTLPNGVDVDEAAPIYEYNRNAYGSERLIFVSRISPEKGVHTLIEAFNLLGAECMETCLELVGPQKAMSYARLSALLHPDQMKTMAPFYNGKTYLQVLTERIDPALTARVRFTGHIPHDQVMDRFRDAYVLIQPSISEALGNAPLEAMACGVPVIGTMTGGIPEAVVDGETGFLVTPGDARALANAILALLHDPARQHAMKDKARQRAVSRFSWDKVVNDLNSLYEEALAQPH